MRICTLCLLVLLSLVACSPIKNQEAGQLRTLSLSQQQLRALSNWKLRGRLLIRSDDILTANIQWQHKSGRDVIQLSGALGMGAVRIELDSSEIVLDNGQGEIQRSKEVDAFIARQVGFVVPITALRQWVLGAHLIGEPVSQKKDGFQQLGWHIVYADPMPTLLGMMPGRIKVSKEKITLKLVIDQWEIE